MEQNVCYLLGRLNLHPQTLKDQWQARHMQNTSPPQVAEGGGNLVCQTIPLMCVFSLFWCSVHIQSNSFPQNISVFTIAASHDKHVTQCCLLSRNRRDEDAPCKMKMPHAKRVRHSHWLWWHAHRLIWVWASSRLLSGHRGNDDLCVGLAPPSLWY